MIRGKLAGTCLSNAFCGGVDLTRETERRSERKVKIARITFGTLVAIHPVDHVHELGLGRSGKCVHTHV